MVYIKSLINKLICVTDWFCGYESKTKVIYFFNTSILSVTLIKIVAIHPNFGHIGLTYIIIFTESTGKHRKLEVSVTNNVRNSNVINLAKSGSQYSSLEGQGISRLFF